MHPVWSRFPIRRSNQPGVARVVAVAGVVLAGLVLAACGGPAGAPAGSAPDAVAGASYACHGDPVPLEALRDGPPATELGDEGLAALEGAEVPDVEDLAAWTVVEESDVRVVLMRELPAPRDMDMGTVHTHERLAVERFGPEDADGRPGWHLRSMGTCDLQRQLDDLAPADLLLDPAAPPSPDSEELALLVVERACASGQPADGRIEIVELEITDHEVQLVIGVEPRDGDQTCPSNPPTPFTVELDAPLGERTVVDASVWPYRPLAASG